MAYFPPPPSVVVRLKAALRVAFGVVGNWKLALDILHLPLADGGQGLLMPDAYLWTAHASTFWRYLQQPTRIGLSQRTALRDWLAYKGIVHNTAQLHLLQMSPCAACNAPWLVYSVKAFSGLNRLRSRLSLSWQEIASAPLWNSCLFTVGNKTVTCRYLICLSILRVRDLVDSGDWVVRLLPEHREVHRLRHAAWDKFFGVLRSLARAWESKLPVIGCRSPHNFERGLCFTPLSQGIVCALREDR